MYTFLTPNKMGYAGKEDGDLNIGETKSRQMWI